MEALDLTPAEVPPSASLGALASFFSYAAAKLTGFVPPLHTWREEDGRSLAKRLGTILLSRLHLRSTPYPMELLQAKIPKSKEKAVAERAVAEEVDWIAEHVVPR